MMKTIQFKKLLLVLFVVPGMLLAHDGKTSGKYTKEKTIKKSFDVNSDALLIVRNSYGNLNIISTSGNKVLIEVHIKTNGDNEEKVQKKLDDISVDFNASSSEVSAKTLFNKEKDGWGWNWGNNNSVSMQVNYTIQLPIKNRVDLNNDYGAIVLDRIDGHAKINCDYGRLDIGELRGRNNQLNFDYTSKSRIGFMASGTIDADYSGFILEKAGDVSLNADYTNATIEEMENLQYVNDYGNLEINEVNNIQGNGDYLGLKLGTVHGNVDINADYGSISIDQMAEDAGNIEIRTDYTDTKIGYNASYNFNFEISTRYASVSGKDDFEINISKEKSSERYYKGYRGNASSGNAISINSSYGNISFKKQ